jgi:hypothetical protein
MPALDRPSLDKVCTRFSVRRLSLFDESAIRGKPKQDAALVELDAPQPTDLADLREALRMDVFTEELLPPHARSRIVAEARLQHSRPLDRAMARMRSPNTSVWASPMWARIAGGAVALGAGGLGLLARAPGAPHRHVLVEACVGLLLLGPLALVKPLTQRRAMWDASPRIRPHTLLLWGIVPLALCALALSGQKSDDLTHPVRALERLVASRSR